MRFFLAWLLFLSPLFVMGADPLEEAFVTMATNPKEFESALGYKAEPVANWLVANAPSSGHTFESVKQVYHHRPGIPVTRKEVADWINNDLSRIRGHNQAPHY